MAILSEILGTSFGRSAPQPFSGGGVRMPPMQVPSMYAAPMRNGASPAQQAPPTPAQSPDGSQPQSIADMAARAANGFAGRHGVHLPSAETQTPLPANSGGAAVAPQAGGVMGSIGSAFNSGYGNALDMSKLMAMLPMIAG